MSLLSKRQGLFVNALVITRNGAEAARRAGYSVKTARQIASENLTKPYIQAAIAAKETELATALEIDRNAIIGGIFEAIATAKASADAGQVIRGWVEVAKLTGLDKPDAAPVRPVGAAGENEALRMKLEALSDAELADIASGRRAAP